MKTYAVEIIGKTPLLMHHDNIEWADYMDTWKNDPGNKKTSKAGDDRSPAWRARIIERGLVLTCQPGRAFVVATGEQISAMTHGVLSHIGRQSKAQRKRLSTVRPESEIEKQTVEHHGRLMLMIERESKKARLNILPNSQPDEPVRISPPEKATA